MKDFAKSIVCNTKVGNSNKAEIIEKKKKEGATLKVDNGQKLEFSDGSTYVKTSFSNDYREAPNHVGNSYSWTPTHGGYYRLEDDKPGSHRPNLEAHVRQGQETGNTKVGNDTPWEYAHRKPKVINDDKTGAEEFFKKLAHDVDEREKKDDAEIKLVGNETYQHKLYPDKYVIIEGKNYKIITDGKVEKTGVLTDAVLYGINQTYKKVGNFKTGTSQLKPGDKVMSFGRKGTVKEVIGENTDNIYGEPLIKVEFEDGTTKTIGEHYMRKVGNAKYVIQYERNLRAPMAWGDYNIVDEANPKKIIRTTSDKEEAKRICEELNRNQSSKWTDVYKHFTKASTSELDKIKTKKDALDFLMAKGEHPNEPAVQEAARRFFGNKRTGNVKDKNDRDLKVGDVVDVRGKKGKITKIIGDVIEVFYDNRGTYNPDRTDRHYADEATKVGNKNLDWNVGNIDWDVANFNGQWYITKNGQKLKGPFPSMKEAEKYLDGHKWELQDKYGNKQTGNALFPTSKYDDEIHKLEMEYQNVSRSGGNPSEILKKTADIEKKIQHLKELRRKETGNSASDDKFAYVMKEFDAGKLKTPDGKVVTDPAQAKAIAYSESKKTENGLARARKAIK